MSAPMRTIGQYKIGTLVLESFGLDGGAMFGAVPKAIWAKQIPPDDKNRIPLVTRVLLIHGPTSKILVDCGNGEKWSEKQREIFAFSSKTKEPVRSIFKQIDTLILTHLHFDHAAGSVYLEGDGNLKLSFPNAKHILQAANWNIANSPGVRERASYLPDTVSELSKANLELVENGHTPFPRISLHRVDGHTQGLQWVLIEDELETVAYPSDLIPTAHHVSIPFVMGYDLCAETTMREKNEFLTRASENNWLIIFEHDWQTVCGRVKREKDSKFVFVPEKLADLELNA